MRINRLHSLLFVALLVLLSACAHKHGGGVLSPAKLEAVLYDYHLAQVMVNDLPANQRYKKELYFAYVYDKHGVTKADIDSSLVYYARHPKGLSEVYANLSKRVEDDIQRLDEEDKPLKVREAISVAGDSADLWYDVNFVEMNASTLKGNKYTFTIPTDTNFRPLDHIVWGGEVRFLDDEVDSLYKYLHLSLRVAYMNDTVVYADTMLCASGMFSLEVYDSAMVRNIDGVAYMKSRDADERLLILSPSLMRYRHGSDSLVVDSAVMQQIGEMQKEVKLPEGKMKLQIAHE